MKTGEKLKSDKISQTTQQCLKKTSPSESKTSLVKFPAVAEVKTERVAEVDQSLEHPIKKEPEDRDNSSKDGNSLGIKIVECWSLQRIKEEPVDVPLTSQSPPHAGVRCKSEGGAAETPKVKQEAKAEECHSGGCRKRPSSPPTHFHTDPETVHKKFRPLHQSAQESLCGGRPNPSHNEGAWPVKMEKDPTSRDFPGAGQGNGATLHSGQLASPILVVHILAAHLGCNYIIITFYLNRAIVFLFVATVMVVHFVLCDCCVEF